MVFTDNFFCQANYVISISISSLTEIVDGLCCKLTMPCPKPLPVTSDLSYKTKDQWEIARSSIVLIERLGAGQFGEVWRGERPRFARFLSRPFSFPSRALRSLSVREQSHGRLGTTQNPTSCLSRLLFFFLPAWANPVTLDFYANCAVMGVCLLAAHVPCKRAVIQASTFRRLHAQPSLERTPRDKGIERERESKR